MGAIDNNADALKAEAARESALGKFDIAGLRVLDALGPADARRRRQSVRQAIVHVVLDFLLHLVGELETVRPEQLDAVVAIAVVRGRNHHAQIRPQ